MLFAHVFKKGREMCTSTSELKTVALVALFVCTHFKLMSYLDSEDVFFFFLSLLVTPKRYLSLSTVVATDTIFT